MSEEITCKKCDEIIREPPAMLGKDFYHIICFEKELDEKVEKTAIEHTQDIIDKSALLK